MMVLFWPYCMYVLILASQMQLVRQALSHLSAQVSQIEKEGSHRQMAFPADPKVHAWREPKRAIYTPRSFSPAIPCRRAACFEDVV